jgi:hypothetical protein
VSAASEVVQCDAEAVVVPRLAWEVEQFGPGGKVPQGVRDAVAAARAVGLPEARLVALLRRRVGLMGGGRFLDLLLEGRADTVVDAIRSASVRA